MEDEITGEAQSEEIGCKYEYDGNINNTFHKKLPRGEFIMFDRKYLVRFNTEAELLEVFIGELLEEFSKVFSQNGGNHLLPLKANSFTTTKLPLISLGAKSSAQ